MQNFRWTDFLAFNVSRSLIKSAKVCSQENYQFLINSSITTSSQPLNISEVLEEWNIIKMLVLNIIAPHERMSVFQPSFLAYNLSSIQFAYYVLPLALLIS